MCILMTIRHSRHTRRPQAACLPLSANSLTRDGQPIPDNPLYLTRSGRTPTARRDARMGAVGENNPRRHTPGGEGSAQQTPFRPHRHCHPAPTGKCQPSDQPLAAGTLSRLPPAHTPTSGSQPTGCMLGIAPWPSTAAPPNNRPHTRRHRHAGMWTLSRACGRTCKPDTSTSLPVAPSALTGTTNCT